MKRKNEIKKINDNNQKIYHWSRSGYLETGRRLGSSDAPIASASSPPLCKHNTYQNGNTHSLPSPIMQRAHNSCSNLSSPYQDPPISDYQTQPMAFQGREHFHEDTPFGDPLHTYLTHILQLGIPVPAWWSRGSSSSLPIPEPKRIQDSKIMKLKNKNKNNDKDKVKVKVDF